MGDENSDRRRNGFKLLLTKMASPTNNWLSRSLVTSCTIGSEGGGNSLISTRTKGGTGFTPPAHSQFCQCTPLLTVGNLPEGYIRNSPLPRVPRDQSTFQTRVPPVHMIPVYYEETHVVPTYNSFCRIGERVATANSPQWQPIAIIT